MRPTRDRGMALGPIRVGYPRCQPRGDTREREGGDAGRPILLPRSSGAGGVCQGVVVTYSEIVDYGNTKVRLHNMLTGKVQPLSPTTPGEVRLYSCGPAVYNYAHVGNLRTCVFSDVLRRTLRIAGLRVRQVIDVTDVGHLQSNADEGEYKMTLATKREARFPWQIARFCKDRFFEDCERLNILRPEIVPIGVEGDKRLNSIG